MLYPPLSRSKRLPQKCVPCLCVEPSSLMCLSVVLCTTKLGTSGTGPKCRGFRYVIALTCTKTKSDSRLVMLQAMKEDPPLNAKCKDKFLIQSTVITPDKETMSLQDIVRCTVYCYVDTSYPSCSGRSRKALTRQPKSTSRS
jgi:hypothetical protein